MREGKRREESGDSGSEEIGHGRCVLIPRLSLFDSALCPIW